MLMAMNRTASPITTLTTRGDWAASARMRPTTNKATLLTASNAPVGVSKLVTLCTSVSPVNAVAAARAKRHRPNTDAATRIVFATAAGKLLGQLW